MAPPLARPKHRQQDAAVDHVVDALRSAWLLAWGVRAPALLGLAWLRFGWVGVILATVCVADGRAVWRHEAMHWKAQRIRATWDRTALDVGLAAKGRCPRIRRIVQAPTGLAITMRPRGGEHEGQFRYATQGLELAWRAMSIDLRRLERGRVRFDVTYRNEIANPIAYPETLAPWDAKTVPFGVDVQGRPVTMPLWNSHLLIAGLTGSGKSGTLHVVMAGIAPLDHTALVLCDPKRVELQHWQDRASVVATDLAAIDHVLARTLALVRSRFVDMERHRLRVLVPDEHHPHVVVVIDELALIVNGGTDKAAKQREAWMIELAATARAAAVTLVLATQRPAAVTIPTQVRDQIPRRIAHATANQDHSRMILGDNPEPAHLLSLATPGVAYIAVDGQRRAELARAYWIDDARIETVAEKYAHLRVDPGVIGLG